MKILTFTCAIALTGLAASPALAQEKKTAAPPAAGQAMPPLPKPGPEHAILSSEVGVWDAKVESFMAPGAPASVSTGSETNTLLGGMWLITDFKGDFMGMPFAGHGTMGWDPSKKKYVGTWVDSMSTGISIMENTYDSATKTMTGWMEGPDMEGRISKMKAVTEHKNADTRVFSMYQAGPDGKEALGMRITYTRRK